MTRLSARYSLFNSPNLLEEKTIKGGQTHLSTLVIVNQHVYNLN